jgi:putative pyruvate formate lyase activating enzyme
MNYNYPSYLRLYQTGELKKRVEYLEKILYSCHLCPRSCGINRMKNEKGYCRSGYLPIVQSFTPHFGEEPVLVGKYGSGTIFFGNCNLKCVYCQNYYISQELNSSQTQGISIEELSEIMLKLQKMGCHNVNLVSPIHFVPQIVKAIYFAIHDGFNLPIVYNTNSYESVETIKLLDEIIDIYLPDIKYGDNSMSLKYSDVKNYVEHSQSAILEMWRQVGKLTMDENGIAKRGVLIRHLILPKNIAGSYQSLKFISEKLSPEATLSIMGQYYPAYKAHLYPEINRPINEDEYEGVMEIIKSLNMEENVFVQKLESHRYYQPDFSNKENPFTINSL